MKDEVVYYLFGGGLKNHLETMSLDDLDYSYVERKIKEIRSENELGA